MIEAIIPNVQSFAGSGERCSAAGWNTCLLTGLAPEVVDCVREDFPEWAISTPAGSACAAVIHGGGKAPAALASPLTPPDQEQGYALRIVPEGARIDARDAAGLWYGLQTLRVLLDAEQGELPLGDITDWPAIPYRGIHLDLKGYGPRFERLLEIVRLLSRYKINVILLELEDKFAYQATPGVAVPEAYTAEQLGELSRYCRARQIQVMPKLQSLGHVDYLLKHPQYRELREDGHPFQYCPRNPDGLRLWSAMAEELLDIFAAHDFFHIGADEAMYLGQCPVCREYRRADTFLYRVRQCLEVVKARGKTPLMWEDILRNLHGHLEPDELERTWALGNDAVLMYWSYGYGGANNTFPFLQRYIDVGMRVWGASGFSGCGPSWVQNVPPLPERALNIAAWTKAAVENKLEGVVATGWTKIGSADPPAEPIEACWFTMLYAADSMWAGRERELATFCQDAYRSFFGGSLPAGLLDYLLQCRTAGLWDETQFTVPRNADRLRLLLAAARYDALSQQRNHIYETLHMYHGLLGEQLADYRREMVQGRIKEFHRLLETCRAQYSAALETLAGPSTVHAIIQSRFGRDAVLLEELEGI